MNSRNPTELPTIQQYIAQFAPEVADSLTQQQIDIIDRVCAGVLTKLSPPPPQSHGRSFTFYPDMLPPYLAGMVFDLARSVATHQHESSKQHLREYVDPADPGLRPVSEMTHEERISRISVPSARQLYGLDRAAGPEYTAASILNLSSWENLPPIKPREWEYLDAAKLGIPKATIYGVASAALWPIPGTEIEAIFPTWDAAVEWISKGGQIRLPDQPHHRAVGYLPGPPATILVDCFGRDGKRVSHYITQDEWRDRRSHWLHQVQWEKAKAAATVVDEPPAQPRYNVDDVVQFRGSKRRAVVVATSSTWVNQVRLRLLEDHGYMKAGEVATWSTQQIEPVPDMPGVNVAVTETVRKLLGPFASVAVCGASIIVPTPPEPQPVEPAPAKECTCDISKGGCTCGAIKPYAPSCE